MSHHIDFNIPMPSEKKTESPKLRKMKDTTSAKKRENRKLDIDNKQMEWRLNQLKMVMAKEKEEREQQNFHWKSGKSGALESHARNVLGRTVSKTSTKPLQRGDGSPKVQKPPKFSVLTDEPLDIPKRRSHSKDLINKLMKPTPPKAPLNESHSNSNNVSQESWISIAKDRSEEEIMEILSDHDGNLPLTSLQSINPAAIGLYYMRYGRKRLLLALDSKVMKPKSGWGSEVYYPYVSDIAPQKLKMVPTPPTSSRRSINKVRRVGSIKDQLETPKGGQLLDGTFDEEGNASAFQRALMEWRKTNAQEPESPRVEMSVHGVQSDPVNIDVEFSETSTLTYMERLLLKKHRSTEVPPLPSLEQEKENSGDTDENKYYSEYYGLTEEEIEEHERFRDMFTPRPSQHGGDSVSTIEAMEQVCDILEINDPDIALQENNWTVTSSKSTFYVEEVSDDEDLPDTHIDEIMNASTDFNENVSKIPNDGSNSVVSESFSSTQDDLRCMSATPSVTDFTTYLNQLISNEVIIPPSEHVDNSSAVRPVSAQEVTSEIRREFSKSKESSSLVIQDHKKESVKTQKSSLVATIGKIPLNPDAVYQRGLDEFQSEMKSGWNEIDNNLDQPSSHVMLCSQGPGFWSAHQSVAADHEESGANIIPTNFTQVDNDIEREMDDANTLDALEWELASQTGNITSDGRISRLIDEWSSDDDVDLGIINDPGFGSGLSTPEVPHIGSMQMSPTLWQGGKTQNDFRKMEMLMLADLNTDSDGDDPSSV